MQRRESPGMALEERAGRLSRKLLQAVAAFIKKNYTAERPADASALLECPVYMTRPAGARDAMGQRADLSVCAERSLGDLLADAEATFSEALLRLIDSKGKTDPEIYKQAHIDRKLFSKIRSNPAYQPSKATALALAIALELNLDETRDFIGRAGYALSHSSKADIIVEYFIRHGEYDLFTINATLFAFQQTPLSG